MKSIRDSDNLAAACGMVLNKYLNAMLAHEAGTRDGRDVEDLHQMRVAVRTLRAALRVFQKAVDPASRVALDSTLMWIGAALGPVRDLDVFLDRMAIIRSEVDGETAEALREVDRIIHERRNVHRNAMIAALDDPRYSAFSGGLRRRIKRLELALFSGPDANLPVIDASRALLNRLVKRAVGAVESLEANSPPEALHAARRRVRRLRYALEFLGGLYGPAAKRLRKHARRIQDHLGEHQDAIVAQSLLQSVIEELRDVDTAPEVYVAIGQAIQREVRHAESARAQFFEERDALRDLATEFKRAIQLPEPSDAAPDQSAPETA